MKDNRGSKLTIGRGGMLKIQHLVTFVRPGGHNDPSGCNQQSRIAYIEFFVKPEEDEHSINDSWAIITCEQYHVFFIWYHDNVSKDITSRLLPWSATI